MAHEASDQQLFLLAALPPSRWQIGLALGIVLALLIAFGATAPFANTQLPRVDGFIPALETAIVISDLATSALLFAQFSIVHRLALLVLASGYLFTGLIVIPHMLTFPGAFAPTGLLGAGPQSTAWLYHLWKVSLPVAIIVYVLLKDSERGPSMAQRSPVAAIGWSVAAVIAMACGLTWVATAGEWLLPGIVGGATATRHLVGGLDISLITGALSLLWLRRRSVLDLWLMVMCCILLLEIAMAIMLVDTRFSLGFYASRFYALVGTIVVLLVLLSETKILYAYLARSVMKHRQDREGRQIAMDVMAASIAHEIKQPLGAMVTNANAALRWMAKATPDLDEARAALKRIVDEGQRANQIIGGIRSMFKKDIHGRAQLAVNDLVREVATMIEVDLRTQRASISLELREGLPHLIADRGQLQQVFLNLCANAIDAMRFVDRVRLLRIKSDIIKESSHVLVTIEDSGIGIDEKNRDRIFEPFFTTKSSGTGIGLTICRSIVESHGGSLQVSANNPYGTSFISYCQVATHEGGGKRPGDHYKSMSCRVSAPSTERNLAVTTELWEQERVHRSAGVTATVTAPNAFCQRRRPQFPSYVGATGGEAIVWFLLRPPAHREILMEARTLNHLPPAASHDGAVRCLLGIEPQSIRSSGASVSAPTTAGSICRSSTAADKDLVCAGVQTRVLRQSCWNASRGPARCFVSSEAARIIQLAGFRELRFFPCAGNRDEASERALADAFAKGGLRAPRKIDFNANRGPC
jgi:signal transduction histidine kinase